MDEFDIKPVNTLKRVLKENTLGIVSDISEIGLDTLINGEILKEFPIIGSVFRAGNTALAIKDVIDAKRVLVFVQRVQGNDVEHDELNRHIEYLNANPQKASAELETVLDYLSKQTGYKKAKILANFYYAFLEKRLKWEDFVLLADVIEDVSVSDLPMLQELYAKRIYTDNDRYDRNCAKRLDRCNLIDYYNGMVVSSQNDPNTRMTAAINNVGRVFVEIGLSNLSNDLYSV